MIYVCFATGSEELEFVTIVDVLRRGGLRVASVGVGREQLIYGSHGIGIMTDVLVDEVSFDDCDMLVLPGGMDGTNVLMNNKVIKEGLLQLSEDRKPIAAICAAPVILGEMGLLGGYEATIYPGMEEHLIDAFFTEDRVVADGDRITSRGPGTAMEFAVAIVEYFNGRETADRLRDVLIMKA